MNGVTGVLAAVGSVLLMSAGAARAGDIAIALKNDDLSDLIVTVYDLATHPPSVVLQSYRISGFTSLPITVSADETGTGHVSWTAATTDPSQRQCGHAERRNLADGSSVRVRARSRCTPSPK
jgi:hypothetical protein